MDAQANIRERLKSLLNELAVEEGTHPTSIDGVFVNRTTTSSSVRYPVVYQPRVFIVGQGRKRVYFGDKVYVYDAFNYLVSSVPMPAECEWEASPNEPVLVVSVGVDPAMLGEMTLEMDEISPHREMMPQGLSTTPMSVELGIAVVRLLECLKCSVDSRMLGHQMVREVIYRVLRGDRGGALRSLASRDEQFSRIARVLRHIHAEYANPLRVEDLARQAGMTHDGYNAGEAARAVGYESASQFGREFKRLFGATPLEETQQLRSRLAVG
jgi:AraC-like DNA-binding protein